MVTKREQDNHSRAPSQHLSHQDRYSRSNHQQRYQQDAYTRPTSPPPQQSGECSTYTRPAPPNQEHQEPKCPQQSAASRPSRAPRYPVSPGPTMPSLRTSGHPQQPVAQKTVRQQAMRPQPEYGATSEPSPSTSPSSSSSEQEPVIFPRQRPAQAPPRAKDRAIKGHSGFKRREPPAEPHISTQGRPYKRRAVVKRREPRPEPALPSSPPLPVWPESEPQASGLIDEAPSPIQRRPLAGLRARPGATRHNRQPSTAAEVPSSPGARWTPFQPVDERPAGHANMFSETPFVPSSPMRGQPQIESPVRSDSASVQPDEPAQDQDDETEPRSDPNLGLESEREAEPSNSPRRDRAEDQAAESLELPEIGAEAIFGRYQQPGQDAGWLCPMTRPDHDTKLCGKPFLAKSSPCRHIKDNQRSRGPHTRSQPTSPRTRS